MFTFGSIFRRNKVAHTTDKAPAQSAASFDPETVDSDGLLAELKELRREIDAALGEEDLAQLRKMERWGRSCTALGALTAGLAPNPASALLLALGRSTRWMMMHHIGHRGYDHVPNVPPRYTSKVFARGARRFLDWADWMTPEAWIYEHNVLHHSYTGELRDPDLIERNTENLRRMLPRPLRYVAMAALSLSWRPGYYAPNTLRTWKARGAKTPAVEEAEHYDLSVMFRSFFDLDLWTICYLPYSALHFAIFPLLYAPLGPWAVFSAWCNSLGAEMLSNLHTFAVVGPNHTGEDLYRYDERPPSRGEAYVRQIIGSVNYHTGNDLIDYLHLNLNYQIEHHIWPDIPMLKYQQIQPKVKALCAKYNVPYVQESVFTRIKKMVAVAVGEQSMRRLTQTKAKSAKPSAAA
jgi:fatty acid desaturase